MKSRTKKRIRKSILTSIVTVIMVFTFCVPPISAVETETEPITAGGLNSDFSEERAQLEEVRATAAQDEFIPVFIFFNNFDLEDVHDKMKKEDGIDYRDFEDEERFEKNIVPDLKAEADNTVTVARSGDPIAAAEEILEFKKSNTYNDFLATKRSNVKESITTLIDGFVESLDSDKVRVGYVGSYAQYVELEIRNDYIDYVVSRDEVGAYGYSNNDEDAMVVPDMCTASGHYQDIMNITDTGVKYLGRGITIGILEAVTHNATNPALRYSGFDETTPHLKEGYSSGRITWIPNPDVAQNFAGKSDHATNVVSIAGGDAVMAPDGTYYQGVAPQATIICSEVGSIGSVKTGINLLIDRGANLINCSFGYYEYEGFSKSDLEYDLISYNTAVTIVTSAGNAQYEDLNGDGVKELKTQKISSPGVGYNVITVGNAVSSESELYIRASSSYDQTHVPTYPNKPDLSAIGTDIYLVKEDETGEIVKRAGSGTSYSAPIVAGVVARMMQQSTTLRGSPERVKAILTATATPINSSSDPACLSRYNSGDRLYVYQKSGAGLLNASACHDAAYSYFYEDYIWNEPDGTFATKKTVTLSPGRTLRVSLCFTQKDSLELDQSETYVMERCGTNNDLRITDKSTSKVLAKSCSIFNNVEVVEYTNNTSHNMSINIQAATLSIHNGAGIAGYTLAWYIFK